MGGEDLVVMVRRQVTLIGAEGEKKARDDSSFWETSGMIEVPAENAGGRSAYLVTVQAHSLETDGYGEGGQVLLCRPKAV